MLDFGLGLKTKNFGHGIGTKGLGLGLELKATEAKLCDM